MYFKLRTSLFATTKAISIIFTYPVTFKGTYMHLAECLNIVLPDVISILWSQWATALPKFYQLLPAALHHMAVNVTALQKWYLYRHVTDVDQEAQNYERRVFA
jgi:hypothetical protein